MIFKDRRDAALKLYQKLKTEPLIKKGNVVVISLLRGGAILGDILSQKITAKHLPLAVTKIGAPGNEELAIGALVFDVVYLEKRVIDSLLLLKPSIRRQITLADSKFKDYCKKFSLKAGDYDKWLKGKTVVLVDDGIATGATMKASALFVRERGAGKVIVASPVSSEDFNVPGIDRSIILHKDPYFTAVSQFYAHFPQVTDSEVKKILKI